MTADKRIEKRKRVKTKKQK